jgi:glutamate-1-semialdehyde 2,1-aminomutase
MGGAQQLYGVRADMTTLGKIMGGGLPVGAYGGKAELMNLVAPAGPVYQAGTLSGNPAAVAAGIATLDVLRRPGVYERLETMAQALTAGLSEAAKRAGVALTINRIGSVFTPFFCAGPVTDYASAKQSDTAAFGRFFRAMLDRGVYLPPSQFETGFVSTAHSERDVEDTLRAASEAFASL